MTPSPQAKRFNWTNLGTRAVSALILAPAALYGLLATGALGAVLRLTLISVVVALLAIEWAMMSARQSPTRIALALTTAVLAALFTADFGHYRIMWLILVLGAGAAALIARGIAARPADAAFGALYIGGPCLALLWLRADGPHGEYWTALVLAVAWASDIAAFLVGSALKGPKLWPQFSPNKTWSGFIGGLLAATLAALALSRFLPMGLDPLKACALGLFAGLATMAGDLWESMLKRRFGVKDSGDLIPGHGGLLDRVDGLMFAVLAVAAARLLVNLGWPR
jgi:phosphatidate cytidylyltransferase